MVSHRNISSLVFLLLISISGFSQNNGFVKKFKTLDFAEKKWVLTHLFKAKKAWQITQYSLLMAKKMKKDSLLDGDESGGQIDAFRHGFWMASLSQKIGARAALKLENAHEKANENDYKKRKLEEGSVPDKAAGDMDLQNNKIGVAIGKANRSVSEKELVEIIKKEILTGNFWVIKKNTNGDFLTENGEILQLSEYRGKWITPKCLVRSNYKR